MCWADRVAAAFFVIIAAAVLLIGMLAGAPDHRFELGAWLWAYVVILWTIGPKLVLPLWLALRAIDFIAGGPRRRAQRRRLAGA